MIVRAIGTVDADRLVEHPPRSVVATSMDIAVMAAIGPDLWPSKCLQ
jgi:hypothetical protein